ncbi:MAG TPA: DNA-deoxyinosine glycosylase [Bifidobacterium sp.]|nr:DNA-deoxyinosine glycosylase [Bifidobacterium sp.]
MGTVVVIGKTADWRGFLILVVLGSMPSPKSRAMRFYYGHPRNRFWPVMAEIFKDESCMPAGPNDIDGTGDSRNKGILSGMDSAERRTAALVERRRRFALRHHIALWDVIASCDIVGASDASIRNAKPNDIASIIARSRITHVFATGAKASQLYRRLCQPHLETLGYGPEELPMTQLPSTSPANARTGLPQLVDAYRSIKTTIEHSGKEE